MNAFPSPRDPKTGSDDKGMSLRDYFAAKAFQGLLSIYADGLTSIEKKDKDEKFGTWISYVAYKMADEMLEARGK